MNKNTGNCLLCGEKLSLLRKDAKFCEDLCRWRYHYYKKEGKEDKIEQIRSRGQGIKEKEEDIKIRSTRYKSPSLRETLDIINKL